MNRDVYVTRAQASLVAGVNPAVIGNWRARGWVTPDGERRTLAARPGRGGHLEYRVGDILDAARDTAANPRSPGREMVVHVAAA